MARCWPLALKDVRCCSSFGPMNRRKPEKLVETNSFTWGGELPLWHVRCVVLAAFVIGAALYSSALNGRFVFDDEGLPFRSGIRDESLSVWVSGVRPLLMFSYWLNYSISGQDPYSYHVLNVCARPSRRLRRPIADPSAPRCRTWRRGTIREPGTAAAIRGWLQKGRSEEHTSELQSLRHLVCR